MTIQAHRRVFDQVGSSPLEEDWSGTVQKFKVEKFTFLLCPTHYFDVTPWLAIHWIKLSGLYMTVACFFSTGLLKTGRIAENHPTTNTWLWGRWELLLYTVRLQNLKSHTVLTFDSKITVISSLHVLWKSCLSGLHSNIML